MFGMSGSQLTRMRQHDEMMRKNYQWSKPDFIKDAEQDTLRKMVQDEFKVIDMNDPIQRALHDGHNAVEHVYGGAESADLQERDLVKAWRPIPGGPMQMGFGVVHRLHPEDGTVTVQFVPDQNRARLPFSAVMKVQFFTPQYPVVHLQPGQKMPTPAEIKAREEQEAVVRRNLGLPPDAPLDQFGETADTKARKEYGQRWGIPAPTLDALRNRSIPAYQVTGTYGAHFYTNLYKNNFYPQKMHNVSASGHVGVDGYGAGAKSIAELYGGGQGQGPAGGPLGAGGQAGYFSDVRERGGFGETRGGDYGEGPGYEKMHIISHRFIPLNGPELEQDMDDGKWHLAHGRGDGRQYHAFGDDDDGGLLGF